MNSSPVTKPSLILALRDPGNECAWQQFMTLYHPLIFGYCARRTRQEADAADVTQEVLRAIARAIQRFEYSRARGTFRSWVFQVTRSKLYSFLSSMRRQPVNQCDTALELELAEIPSEEESTAWEEDYRRSAMEYVAAQTRREFETRTWDAFWRTSVAGEPVAEVARSLGMSPGAVYIARSRVLTNLNKKIMELTDAEEGLIQAGQN